VRETDVPLTGAAVRGPSQTWDTPAVNAVESPSPASVDAKQEVPGLATRTPVTTCAGVTHRGGLGVNGLTGWLETCSLTPFLPCLHFCCLFKSLLHLCRDPLSHNIQQTCFAVACTDTAQTTATHPTEQKGAATSNSQQKSQKPQKYNFLLHKNCSCHSTTQKLQNSNTKISCSKIPIQTLTLQQIPIPIQKFQNSNPNSKILPNLNQIPNSTQIHRKFQILQKIQKFQKFPEIPKSFTHS
jgi:hypothetical protein